MGQGASVYHYSAPARLVVESHGWELVLVLHSLIWLPGLGTQAINSVLATVSGCLWHIRYTHPGFQGKLCSP